MDPFVVPFAFVTVNFARKLFTDPNASVASLSSRRFFASSVSGVGTGGRYALFTGASGDGVALVCFFEQPKPIKTIAESPIMKAV